MTMTSFPIRAQSPSAQALALAGALVSSTPPDLSPQGFITRREQARRFYEPRVARAQKRYQVEQEQVEIAGVNCLEVTPKASEVSGTLVYFFGGGFVSGWPLQDLFIIATLAEFAGLRVLAPDYRLAPEHPWPAALDDAQAVYSCLARQPLAGGLALAGESAGGNLALALMLRATRLGLRRPDALALMSPWSDVRVDHDYGGAQAMSDPTFDPAALQAAARAYAGRAPMDDPEVSPIFASFTADVPPIRITTGTRDRFLSDCVRLTNTIRSSGGRVDLQVWPGLWHVFEFYDEVPEAHESLREMAEFLRAHCVGRG